VKEELKIKVVISTNEDIIRDKIVNKVLTPDLNKRT